MNIKVDAFTVSGKSSNTSNSDLRMLIGWKGGVLSAATLKEVACHIWASSRENLSSGFPTKRVLTQSPQLQRLARKSKFRT